MTIEFLPGIDFPAKALLHRLLEDDPQDIVVLIRDQSGAAGLSYAGDITPSYLLKAAVVLARHAEMLMSADDED